MAVARAAIDALDWAGARQSLEGLVRSQPSERVCLLMAEIEEGEHDDEGRVRVWLTRAIHAPRDPSWVADGEVFARWAPVSPITGRIDAFEWKIASQPLPQLWAPEIDAGTELDPSGDDRLAGQNTTKSSSVEIVEIGYPLPSSDVGDIDKSPDKDETLAQSVEPAPPPAPKPVMPRAPDDPGPERIDSDIAPRGFRPS
jgi:HemY protein